MKLGSRVFLLASVAAAAGWSQEVNVSSTTIVQMWTQETPGFQKQTFAPAMEFLAIDATKVGMEGLSLHLFGWGQADLREQSSPENKSNGDLSFGYLKYRFSQSNAEIIAGRFTVNQGVAIEQVDGVSAKVDLAGGFAVSAFGGRPVLYKTVDPADQKDYKYQRDAIFGTRLSYRMPKYGEVGLSFLQDGTKAAKDLTIPSPIDYTRKQVGVDLLLSPNNRLDISGRTIFDIAQHPDTPAGQDEPSRIAEHDYSLTAKLGGKFVFTGNYTERNFFAYFAGTNMPSLFRQDEHDQFRAYGGRLVWGTPGSFQFVADARHTNRLSFGTANRYGAEARWVPKGTKLQTGFAFHRVTASKGLTYNPVTPYYSLSHYEARAWVMREGTKFAASLDGIMQSFDDRNNPHLNGRHRIGELVASAGYKFATDLKLSADVALATNPVAANEVRGLMKLEWRFGFARKGGQK